jgi:anthranilate 1,2-dioxygenase small subunit/terephthalate 1,2-dioxygenase oxygenase component beta subunit
MIDLLQLCAFNAAYARAIDSDALESWPAFFTEDCHYRITNVENEREGLPAGIVYADSRAMLEDRVASLRQANIYERQSYRHLLGVPLVESTDDASAVARTPFMVARIMHTGETTLFASGEYRDRFVQQGGKLLLAERVAICDSTVIDTLLALPL